MCPSSGYYTITLASVLGSCLDGNGAPLAADAPVALRILDDADTLVGGANQEWALQAL